MSLTEMLQIKYPILQGAMAQIATYELASAVSNAGGLGLSHLEECQQTRYENKFVFVKKRQRNLSL